MRQVISLEYILEVVPLSLELLFGFVIVFLLNELSGALQYLSPLGWILILIQVVLFILIDYYTRVFHYYTQPTLSVRVLEINFRRNVFCVLGAIFLLIFLGLLYYLGVDQIYFYKGLVLLSAWILIPAVSDRLTVSIWRRIIEAEVGANV